MEDVKVNNRENDSDKQNILPIEENEKINRREMYVPTEIYEAIQLLHEIKADINGLKTTAVCQSIDRDFLSIAADEQPDYVKQQKSELNSRRQTFKKILKTLLLELLKCIILQLMQKAVLFILKKLFE